MKNVLFIMPFGKKTFTYKNTKTKLVNFDNIYKKMKKKLIKENLKIHRIDLNITTDIYRKMYQSIHSADIVVADLTGLNPNVMYELGVRHALRMKKTILISQFSSNKIPFNISTYTIFSYKKLISNWDELLLNDTNDSPVKKEISDNYNKDKKIFENYNNLWNAFNKDFNASNNVKKQAQILGKYKESFIGVEEFEQKLALNQYKLNDDVISLSKALKIIEKHNPLASNDYETVGLACSISRKLYEKTKLNVYKQKSFNYSRHFIAIYKGPYSFSSYAMHMIALGENNDLNIIYIQEEAKMLLESYKNCDPKLEMEYLKHTKYLLKVLSGDAKNYYKNKKCEDNICRTSVVVYNRAKKLIQKN